MQLAHVSVQVLRTGRIGNLHDNDAVASSHCK